MSARFDSSDPSLALVGCCLCTAGDFVGNAVYLSDAISVSCILRLLCVSQAIRVCPVQSCVSLPYVTQHRLGRRLTCLTLLSLILFLLLRYVSFRNQFRSLIQDSFKKYLIAKYIFACRSFYPTIPLNLVQDLEV